jgi:hypothetical protein
MVPTVLAARQVYTPPSLENTDDTFRWLTTRPSGVRY